MKNVTLRQMTLTNFKAHKEREILFSDQTNISGANGLGKSTIFDAFVWLLFGKDQQDRKDFEILTNGIERVDAEVSAIIAVDNRAFRLKRVLHPKFVRRRGTAEEVFDGCETLYYIDDVPLKAGEYKGRIDMIIDETVFKMITNPSYFLALNWTKQREVLFQMAGTISDMEIAANNPAFLALLDAISGKSFADFRKELAARKKKLKDDLDDISPKIDQTRRLMPEDFDTATIEAEIAKVDAQIASIDKQMSDHSEAIRAQYEGVQAKQAQINQLRTKQTEVGNEAAQNAQKEAFEANQTYTAAQNELSLSLQGVSAAERSVQAIKTELDNTERKCDALSVSVSQLREKWAVENEKAYKEQEGCLICPVFGTACGDGKALEQHAEAQHKARAAFNEAKQVSLSSIHAEGVAKAGEHNAAQKQLAELQKNYNEAVATYKEIQFLYEKQASCIKDMSLVQPKTVIASELPEWQELDKQIMEIESTIQDVKTVENTDLQEQKRSLVSKRDELKASAGKRDLIAKYKEEIKALELKGRDLAQQISEVEKQEFTIANFTKAKIDECEARINGLFTMIRFQLFDKTIEGNEFEACIATNLNGVKIAATNTAEQINAGLDIINSLCTFNNVTAPIFIDRRESVNDLIHTQSQIINLVVSRDKVLTITNN